MENFFYRIRHEQREYALRLDFAVFTGSIDKEKKNSPSQIYLFIYLLRFFGSLSFMSSFICRAFVVYKFSFLLLGTVKAVWEFSESQPLKALVTFTRISVSLCFSSYQPASKLDFADIFSSFPLNQVIPSQFILQFFFCFCFVLKSEHIFIRHCS